MGVSEADGARLEASAGLPSGPSHIVTLAKHTVVYGLSGVLLQAVGVVTLPVFARAFTQAEYGMLELAVVLSSVTVTLVDLGFASAAQRSYYDYPEADAEGRRRVLFTAIAATSVIALVAAGALLAARGLVDRLLFDGRGAETLIAAVALSVPLVNIATLTREAMRLRFRRWSYLVASVLAAVVSGAVAVVLVVALDVGVEAIFVGVIAGNALGVVYGLAVVHRDVGARVSRVELRRMLAYGLPLVPAALAMWALALIDRVMLGQLADLAEVGQYAVASRVSSLLMLLVTAFALAFGPYIFSLYAEDKETEKAVRAKALTYFTVGLLVGAVWLTLFAREALAVVAPGFQRAYQAVGPLALGVVAFGVSSVVMAGISFARRTAVLPLIAGAAAAVNIGLNLALIPPFGMVGAALAAAAGYAVLALLQHRIAQRLYPTEYETSKLARAFVLALACGAVGLLRIEPVVLALAVKTGAFAAFVLAIRLARVVDSTDVANARRLIAGRLRPAEAAS
ncbi:MAG: oligosaccharide flippase family protein [Thermoleophilia bacterium]|nr:oligosaccharide flippase family protein [Thermoleophilia bacterium]